MDEILVHFVCINNITPLGPIKEEIISILLLIQPHKIYHWVIKSHTRFPKKKKKTLILNPRKLVRGARVANLNN